MRFVPVKSVEQQDIQAAHRMRAILLRHRTALINQMRGLLGERGLAISRSPEEFKRAVPELLRKRRRAHLVLPDAADRTP